MSLKYLAAFALVALSKPAPTKDDVSNVVKAAGGKIDAAELDAVFASLNGKNVNSLIAEGSKKLSAAAPAGGAPAASAAPAAAAAAPAAAKKEAPKKVEEEEDGEMGFGLFD